MFSEICLSSAFQSEQRLKTDVSSAAAIGSRQWDRSKLMVVGEGRVGKTALCNSILGKLFKETESTIGIETFNVDVKMVENLIHLEINFKLT